MSIMQSQREYRRREARKEDLRATIKFHERMMVESADNDEPWNVNFHQRARDTAQTALNYMVAAELM